MGSGIKKIASNIQRGIHPNTILDAAIKGKDLGLRMPLGGKISSSHETFSIFKEQMKPSRRKVDEAFEKIAKKEGLYHSYE